MYLGLIRKRLRFLGQEETRRKGKIGEVELGSMVVQEMAGYWWVVAGEGPTVGEMG